MGAKSWAKAGHPNGDNANLDMRANRQAAEQHEVVRATRAAYKETRSSPGGSEGGPSTAPSSCAQKKGFWRFPYRTSLSTMRFALSLVLMHAVIATDATACDSMKSNQPQLPGPPSKAGREKWMADMKTCRASTLKSIGYNGTYFENPRLKWTQHAFTIPMVQGYERFLYNGTGYTVERYLDDVRVRYGGVDAVLLWPTYENIGLDDRDQIDMFAAMPGGLDAVRELTLQFQAAGVKVIWVSECILNLL
jgi:hypothetical protein